MKYTTMLSFFFMTATISFGQVFVEPDPGEDVSRFFPGGEFDRAGLIKTGSGHVDALNALTQGLADMPSSRFKILMKPRVIEELSLTKYQLHKVWDMRSPEPATIHKEDPELWGYGSVFTIEKKDVPAFKKRMRKLFRAEIEASNDKLDKILNAKQSKRLRQIEFQYLLTHTLDVKKAFLANDIKLKDSQVAAIKARLTSLQISFNNMRIAVLPQLEKSLGYQEVLGEKKVGEPFVFHDGEPFGRVEEFSKRLIDDIGD